MKSSENQVLENIVEVIALWPSEVFIQRHVQALQNEGVPIRIVARNMTSRIHTSASISMSSIPVKVQQIPIFDSISSLKKIEYLLRYAFPLTGFPRHHLHLRQQAILGFFSRLKPGLIHFHNAQLALSMNWICRELRIPYTISLRGADVQVIPLRSEALYKATRAVLAGASGIHTVCDAFGYSELLKGLQTTTIYTTVGASEGLAPYNPSDKDCYQLFSCGRIQWEKAYPDLLVALRGLIDSGLNVQLTIAGTGADKERLHHWIERLNLKERVSLPGVLNFDQIRQLLLTQHAYVQSSCSEGLSNALVEAMAWGCPVFATDVSGTKEVIRDGETGFLLEPLAPHRWPEKLRYVCDQMQMQKVRASAHLEARQRFNARKHAGDFVSFFQKALERVPVIQRAVGLTVSTGKNYMMPVEDHLIGVKTILIDLPWEWQCDTDLVLRMLAPIADKYSLLLNFYGNGGMEDELRYLAQFLGKGRIRVIRIEPNKGEFNQRNELTNVFVKIESSDSNNRMWVLECSDRLIKVPVGNLEQLTRSLVSLLEIKADSVGEPLRL